MNHSDEKTKLPIHVITGTSENAQIKTKQKIRIRNRRVAVAKNT